MDRGLSTGQLWGLLVSSELKDIAWKLAEISSVDWTTSRLAD